ncbi:MAG: flagellar basal body L-ring protein FlgH [Planctomycetota bacterium]
MNCIEFRSALMLSAAILLTGCEVDTRPRKAGAPDIVRVNPTQPVVDNGSIWQEGAGITGALTADMKARTRGDIVTIVIVEKNNAQRARQTDTSKSQNAAMNVDQFFFPGVGSFKGAMPKLGLDSKRTFSGGGTLSDSGSVNATLAVQVVDVLPTGNLLLRGSKEVTISGEMQTVTISGIARLKDIAPDNTILSTSLAEARVHISGRGPLEDAQRRTLTNRLMDFFNLF